MTTNNCNKLRIILDLTPFIASVRAMQESGLNTQIFQLINHAHNALLDVLFGIISGLGDGMVIALLCGVIMMYRLRLGMAALLAFILSGLLAQLLKRIFDTPRPPAVLENVHVLGAALQSHSFPSGHATSDGVLLLAAFFLWTLRDWRSWAMAVVFLLAATGRIYGGVHFPLDVVVGLLLGITCMWLCWRWSESWPVEHWQTSAWSARVIGMIVAIEAAVLGLGYHIQPATAQPLAAVLPIVALVLLTRYWKKGSLTHG